MEKHKDRRNSIACVEILARLRFDKSLIRQLLSEVTRIIKVNKFTTTVGNFLLCFKHSYNTHPNAETVLDKLAIV